MVKDIPQAVVRVHAAERRAVARVLRSGRLIQGEVTAAFEDDFSAVVGRGSGVAVNSGTSALHLGFLAAGIGPGDEVIVPAFTYAGTVNAIVMAGARPVYCDIDPATYTAAPNSVRAAIGPRTAAVVAVHLFGHPCDLDELLAITGAAGVALVEDAAQAHGATWRGRPVGSFGAFSAFSFYPTKNMTTGEGGMIVSADMSLVAMARLLRNQGAARPYEHEVVGLNNRMTEMAAAIGRVQVRRLPARTKRRRQVAGAYSAALAHVRTPSVDKRAEHVFHQYTVAVPAGVDRDAVRARLREAGIATGAYYPTPCHRLKPLQAAVDLPHTDAAAESVIALPIYPELRRRHTSRVAHHLNRLTRPGDGQVGNQR